MKCIEYLDKIDRLLLNETHSVQAVMSKYKTHMIRGRLDRLGSLLTSFGENKLAMVEYFDAFQQMVYAARLRLLCSGDTALGRQSDKKMRKIHSLMILVAVAIATLFFVLSQPKNGSYACRLVKEVLEIGEIQGEIFDFSVDFLKRGAQRYNGLLDSLNEFERVFYHVAESKQFFRITDQFLQLKTMKSIHNTKLFEYSLLSIRKERSQFVDHYNRWLEAAPEVKPLFDRTKRKNAWNVRSNVSIGAQSIEPSVDVDSSGLIKNKFESESEAIDRSRLQQPPADRHRRRFRLLVRDQRKQTPDLRFASKHVSEERSQRMLIGESRNRLRAKSAISCIKSLSTSYDTAPDFVEFHPNITDQFVDSTVRLASINRKLKEKIEVHVEEVQARKEPPIQKLLRLMKKHSSALNLNKFFQYRDKLIQNSKLEAYVSKKRHALVAEEVWLVSTRRSKYR